MIIIELLELFSTCRRIVYGVEVGIKVPAEAEPPTSKSSRLTKHYGPTRRMLLILMNLIAFVRQRREGSPFFHFGIAVGRFVLL